ncbi:hypothetical protein PhCBS80983_g02393 [Powellomyces hirtus]|uniref:Fcf2 pre-rRNA processing C-terminal domain-containing protein n=1 Tax=Powellomyces hirtus TaxID=109895 RepID=A0A507E618_9FUNG|nr:hypothetical protein PhCBS80983_g02393 [Powellomyces hirtus]
MAAKAALGIHPAEEIEQQDDTTQELDLDSLLQKASLALKERQAALISIKAANEESSPLTTVKLNPGYDEKNLYFTNNGKQYGAVRLQADKAAVLEEPKASASGHDGKGSTQRLKVQVGPERFAVQQTQDALPPSLDWTAKQKKAMETETSGPKWFDMPAPELTEELKRDLHILKSRPVIDPKRHYKKNTMSAPPKYFQVGTIIQGPTEFHSARMTRKERRDNITDELMADTESRNYYKRKFLAIQEQKSNFTRKGWKRSKDRK